MKNKSALVSGVCVAALAFCTPFTASAQFKKSSPSPSPSASPSAPASTSTRAFPYHGMISSVDQSGRTFTIAGKEASRVFRVTDKTVVTKDGNPATMTEIAEKEEVRGQYWKNADGSLEAKTVKLGIKPGKAKKAKKEKASTSPEASPSVSPEATP